MLPQVDAKEKANCFIPEDPVDPRRWVIPPESKGLLKWNFLCKMHEEIQMKTSRYTEPQILSILRQAEGGMPVAELCREHGMSNASFYKWRAKYGGMAASMIAQTKALEV